MSSEEPRFHEILTRLADAGVEVSLAGRSFRLLTLGELLAMKKRAARPKDLAMIPYLESAIEEIEEIEGGS